MLLLYFRILVALKQKVQLTFKFLLDCIVQNLNNVAVWHLLLLFPHYCLFLFAQGEKVKHREPRIQLRRFISNNWKEFLAEHLLHT